MFVAELFDRQQRVDPFALFERHEIHERLAARTSARLRQLEHAQPVHPPAIRETQQRVVGMRDEQFFDVVLVFDGSRRLAAPAAPLRLIFGERLALGVARMRERHHHVLRLDQVFGGEIDVIEVDFGTTSIAVFVTNGGEFVTHHLGQALGARQDVEQVDDQRQQLGVFADDLFLLETRQTVEAHVEDGLRLRLAQSITVGVALQAELGGEIFGAG